MFKQIFLSIGLALPLLSMSQIDHWETIVQEGDSWQYILPSSQPSAEWIELDFDDSSWLTGTSGFGYGDDDDQTIVENTLSVLIRRSFNVTSKEDIEEAILHVDYDDGFVAYLNGTEIGRRLVSGNTPAFNQGSDGLHEALLHQGIAPEGIRIDKELFLNGPNILAVQAHNENINSSDLTLNPFLFIGTSSSAQLYNEIPSWFTPPVDFISSNLPIVTIDTDELHITDEPKVHARIGIINQPNAELNFLTDPANELDWFCGIEIRGESSQIFDKKSYGFEIWDAEGNDMDTTFLGFPSEEDFILYGPYSDKSLLNNAFTMHLGRKMGHYASKTQFVELVVNDEYLGLYLLMEKIKRDKNRVDISKLNPDEITADDLTGGYIFRIDKGNYNGWESQYNIYNEPGRKIFFQFYYPDPTEIHPIQGSYIQDYMNEFEEAIASSTYENRHGTRYTKYIDLRSFVDTFILNELSKNIDAYRLSSYFHKHKESKGGRIYAGPLWDFNLSYGNNDFCGVEKPDGWEYYQCQGNSPFWWHEMLQDAFFANALKCRWTALRSTLLSSQNVNHYLDSMTNYLGEAVHRNYQRWPTLGTYVWPNSSFYAQAATHTEVMSIMKNWLEERTNWIDANIPGEAIDCDFYESYGVLSLEINTDKIEIFPNPTDGMISIESQLYIYNANLIDLKGRIVQHFSKEEVGKSIILSEDIKSGIYFFKFDTNQGPILKRVHVER